MSQKLLLIVAGLVGVAAVVLLVVAGVDLARAARTGPGWKRKLLAAGLLLLASLGLGSYAVLSPKSSSGDSDSAGVDSTGDLASSPVWKHLQKTWTEAAEIASGKRGDYPFTQRQEKRLHEEMKRVYLDIETLYMKGLLTFAESGLLVTEWDILSAQVRQYRSVEDRNATCYVPMAIPPHTLSLDRLSAELSLLDELANQEKLQPDVLAKIMSRIEADLAQLESETYVNQLPLADQARAADVRQAARTHIDLINARLSGKPSQLETSWEWKTILDAWAFIEPLAQSGQSKQSERSLADKKMDAARNAINVLRKADLLSQPEVLLLRSEADRLREDLYRNPPTDSRVLCYKMMLIVPARVSLDRLAQRLPLLTQLAESGKLNRAILDKILPAVEADLAILSDAEELNKLPEPDRQRAVELIRTIREQIDKLRPQGGIITCYRIGDFPEPLVTPDSIDDRIELLNRRDIIDDLDPAVVDLARKHLETLKRDLQRES